MNTTTAPAMGILFSSVTWTIGSLAVLSFAKIQSAAEMLDFVEDSPDTRWP